MNDGKGTFTTAPAGAGPIPRLCCHLPATRGTEPEPTRSSCRARCLQRPAYFRSQLTDLSINPPSEFFLNPTADVPKTGRNAGTHILNSSGILYVEITLVLYLNYLTDKFKQYIHESKAGFGERIGDNFEVII